MANDAPNNTAIPSSTVAGAGSGSGAANTPSADPTSVLGSANANTTVRPGGAPARVYMNEKIVPYLLEGMKNVTKEQPANPLHVLGEFLIQKSAEVEGQGSSGKSPE
ncbi:hypothetical protein BDV18DRAFT_145410 [Aspergillus unguis]